MNRLDPSSRLPVFNFLFSHGIRTLLMVKENKTLYPGDIGLLEEALILKDIMQLVEIDVIFDEKYCVISDV